MSTETASTSWQKIGPNLLRYSSSGVYFARIRVSGKLHRESLKTTDYQLALRRLKTLESKLRNRARDAFNGKMTFGDVLKELRDRGYRSGKLRSGKKPKPLKPRTRDYYEQRIQALLKSWKARFGKDLEGIPVSKITDDLCDKWANTFAPGNDAAAEEYGARSFSASAYNHTIGVLWHALQIAVAKGSLLENPAGNMGRAAENGKQINVPSPEEFRKLVSEIESPASGNVGRFSRACADLVRFLAFTGCRLGEAKEVRWQDCDFESKRITVWGHPETRTKNGQHRFVPMIPEAEKLLLKLRKERAGESGEQKVMKVFECQKAVDRAAAAIGIPRITHHDLRHTFATRCIQCGVDVKSLATWLGHKDGGALILKTYSHYIRGHGEEMAKLVKFDAGGSTTNERSQNATAEK